MAQCKSYSDFKTTHKELRRIYTELNPKKGRIYRPGGPFPTDSQGHVSEVPMEFMRGAIVAIMTTWEAYVRDILEEAFDNFVNVCTAASSPSRRVPDRRRSSSRNWREPSTEETLPRPTALLDSPVVQAIVKKHFETGLKGKVEEVKTQASKLAIEMLQNPEEHVTKCLDEHKQGVFGRKIVPTFFGSAGIDKTFEALFNTTIDPEKHQLLSEVIVKVGGIDHSFRLNFHPSIEQPRLCIRYSSIE